MNLSPYQLKGKIMNSDEILIEKFISSHDIDAIRVLEQNEVNLVATFINEIQIDMAVRLLSKMELPLATSCIEKLEPVKAAQILESVPSAISSSILRKISDAKREHILLNIDETIVSKIEYKLKFIENSVGSQMTISFPTINEELSIKETLEKIRKNPNLTYNYLFIVNRNQKLLGIGHLDSLISGNPNENVSSIMKTNYPFLTVDLNLSKINSHPGWSEYTSLPVLDSSGILLGLLNKKDIPSFNKKISNQIPENILNASNALGELFKIGITSLLYGVAKIPNEKNN